jgi:hypothetical protein
MTFGPGQRTCGDDKVFAVQTKAKKVASRHSGDIFSGGWASKMEIPDATYAITDQLVGDPRYIGWYPDNLAG